MESGNFVPAPWSSKHVFGMNWYIYWILNNEGIYTHGKRRLLKCSFDLLPATDETFNEGWTVGNQTHPFFPIDNDQGINDQPIYFISLVRAFYIQPNAPTPFQTF